MEHFVVHTAPSVEPKLGDMLAQGPGVLLFTFYRKAGLFNCTHKFDVGNVLTPEYRLLMGLQSRLPVVELGAVIESWLEVAWVKIKIYKTLHPQRLHIR